MTNELGSLSCEKANNDFRGWERGDTRTKCVPSLVKPAAPFPGISQGVIYNKVKVLV